MQTATRTGIQDDMVEALEQPDGYVAGAGDCDDSDPGINPGAVEVCDGIDNDCDGEADEDSVCGSVWYRDADDDGYAGSDETTIAVTQPDGYINWAGDCDDSDPEINPQAFEVCDGVDNNCDGQIDEGCGPPVYYHYDADNDGYGDPDCGNTYETDPPANFVLDGTDCDDTNCHRLSRRT